jgi:hypothetical protein
MLEIIRDLESIKKEAKSMLDYEKEKQDVEDFIQSGVKRLSRGDKQRVADILMGMLMAQPEDKKPRYPRGGVPAQCG